MTNEEQAKELLKKYLNKELDPTDTKQVEDWYDSYENDGLRIGNEKKAAMEEQMFIKLQKVMHKNTRSKVLRFSVLQPWLKVAALLVITSGLALAFWPISAKRNVTENLLSLTTTGAENKKITLSDGSEIWLSPSSKLLYPQKFNSSSRVVELAEGEAFFKIAHEKRRNFLVKTSDDLQTKVLGTSFRIKAYRAKKNIDILVATGKVSVGNTHQTFGTLVIGQQICYDKEKQRAMISYTPKPVYTDLIFKGTTLQKAISQLEYTYSIHIALTDPSLFSLKCAAVFNTRQKPEEILEILCSLHNLKYNVSEDHKTFNIYRKMRK